MTTLKLVGLLLSSAAFEFAYVAWAKYAAAGRTLYTVVYSVITGALGLLGLKGALSLPGGELVYLAGLGLGAWLSAGLIGRKAT